MKRKVFIAVGILVSSTILWACLHNFGTSRTYDISYADAENLLLSSLHISLTELIDRPLQAKAGDALADSMSMTLYSATLDRYEPNNLLSFTCCHRYNIGATGGEYIHFDIKRVTPAKTKILVNYSDRWRGMFPPFLFWNPGFARERHIHDQVWGAW